MRRDEKGCRIFSTSGIFKQAVKSFWDDIEVRGNQPVTVCIKNFENIIFNKIELRIHIILFISFKNNIIMCSPYWNTTYDVEINRYYDRALIQRHDYEPINYEPINYNIKPIDIPLWENIFYTTGSIISCILISS